MNRNIRIARQLIRIAKMLVKANAYGQTSLFEDEKFVDMTDSDFDEYYLSQGIEIYPDLAGYFEQYKEAIKKYADKLVQDGYDMDEAGEKAVMDFGENCGYAAEGLPRPGHVVPAYGSIMRQIRNSVNLM